MSRCFPYPPPGYEKSPALIESTKLQKEREKAAKKERKKEKQRGKKEKSRGDEGKKRRQQEEFSPSTHKAGDDVKAREDKSPQLEKSSLTEEQGPAAAQNFCDSSDSTQNSNKRRRHESAEAIASTHGNVLRIRLQLVRHKDSEPPSSSGRIETVPAEREARSTGQKELPSPAERPCCSGRTHAPPSEGLTRVSHKSKHTLADDAGRVDSSSGCGCDLDVRRQYKRLILNWNPPPLQTENPESDDEDWLFGGPARRCDGQGETEQRVAGKDPDLGSALCSWPPRACYLPEAGVYAMPYVVPF